ncbi:MAG: response regulator transcription factor [Sphaerochaeta sp.]|nr:response regulator transcription factor [Sphaerochaeta sp.]
MDKTILVIDDDTRLNAYLSKKLAHDAFIVYSALDQDSSFSLLKTFEVDLVVLDLNLGNGDEGMEILKTIRSHDIFLPVIIISSISSTTTQVEGFDIGCDGYLVKPFYYAELRSRIQRMLKRNDGIQLERSPIHEKILYPPFEITMSSREVRKHGVLLPMQNQLCNLLILFVKNPHQVLTSDFLCNHLSLGVDCDAPVSTLYVYIRRLRKLLNDQQDEMQYIQTIRGIGYVFIQK